MLQNGSFTRTNGANPDQSKVWPQFFTDTVVDEAASAREGRPIYREEERVKVIMPGNALHIPVFKVSQEHIDRWPEQYKAFKEQREPAVDGTPLEEWPILNKAMVAELKHLHIRTVEEMANVSDAVLQRLGMGGRHLKEAALAFLDDAARIALTEEQARRIQQQDAQIATLEGQVENLSQLVERLHSDLQGLKNAPSAVATHIPGMADPIAQAAQQRGGEAPAASALDGFAKRRGTRGKAAQQRASEATA